MTTPSRHTPRYPAVACPSRRTFVKGLAIGGAVAGLGLWRSSAWAQTSPGQQPVALAGTEFDLDIGETLMNFTGSPRLAVTVNGSVPAPTLRWREGDTVTLRVANALREDTSIHWHGVLVPANMDGVPGLSFDGIRPGDAYAYRFTVRQGGTYWYHSHSAFQEQRGVYGALIIEPREPEPFVYDREHVVMLSDWTDEDPGRVFTKLKKQSDYYNFNRRTVGDFVRDIRERGFGTTVADRLAWGEMRMHPTDLADVTGATYTYLMKRPRASRQLDLSLPARRARPAAVHQRGGDELFRRTHSGTDDDGRRRRRPVRPPGVGGRVPHRRGRDLRRHRRAVWSRGVHHLRAGVRPHRLRAGHAGRARGG